MAKISIITATFRDLRGFSRTADSIEAALSSWGPKNLFEWVVVDGAGDPEVRARALRMMSIFETVRYHGNGDSGIYDAMNIGSRQSSGEWCWYLNGGDEMGSTSEVGALIRVLEGLPVETNCLQCSAEYVKNEIPLGMRTPRGVWPWIYHGITANHQAMLIKRSLWSKLLYSDRYRVCGDYEFLARAFKSGILFARNVDLCIARFHVGGISFERHVELDLEAASVQKAVLASPRLLIALSKFMRGISRRRIS